MNKNYILLTTRILDRRFVFRRNRLDSFEYVILKRAVREDSGTFRLCVHLMHGVLRMHNMTVGISRAEKVLWSRNNNRRLYWARQRCIFVCRFPCGRSTASHPTVLAVPRPCCAEICVCEYGSLEKCVVRAVLLSRRERCWQITRRTVRIVNFKTKRRHCSS